ncbi:bifunctional enoyl-CoA hydratase/phosphate acetyltransferase [Dethiobacter alkaliphilus]|uniref:bifunctional enoyl-CoA hydratase/phosphate acetyltransferase n=1 Tax=Dethiobacter alkaliphilus TaxID=427926 RepID=UPI002227C97B|nr:bifunctional enoyl-CoA hydratase/phosphate acetyltransferase [Dethiobacter alkaliphilus]MCW3489546.1 bifunctional enoyl-CoA hydratase/phosphate acetyltransferase [Dethiobacter alkaliphilus]
MSFENYHQVITALQDYDKCRMCIAGAADDTVLQAVREAKKADLVDFVLVGDEERIWRLAMTASLNLQGMEIINIKDPEEAAAHAVELTSKGKADILMKGMVNSADFLRAVLSPKGGLRTDRILSHLAVYEIPGYYRLIYMSDGGLNVEPDLGQKQAILENAVEFLQALGLEKPRAAILTANEKVNPKVQSTVDAWELKQKAAAGEIQGVVVDGPMALDVAISQDAAVHKGLESPVAGRADLLIVPNIEAGNLLGKAIIYFASGKMAGLVLGAKKPVILTSRNEPSSGKMASIALAAYSIVRNR